MSQELSIFVDESGDRAGLSEYYLVCLVFHNQKNDVSESVMKYERFLALSNLPNIPFHSEPLLNGRKEYANLGLQSRKRMISSFATLVRHLPIKYTSFIYKRKEYAQPSHLSKRIEDDLKDFLSSELEFFQQYEVVKVYYDNGQDVVKQALDSSLNAVLSTGVVERRKTSMTDYRLEQVADYLCTIELAATKYEASKNGATYNKFFGGVGCFKRNWLKQVIRKKL